MNRVGKVMIHPELRLKLILNNRILSAKYKAVDDGETGTIRKSRKKSGAGIYFFYKSRYNEIRSVMIILHGKGHSVFQRRGVPALP